MSGRKVRNLRSRKVRKVRKSRSSRRVRKSRRVRSTKRSSKSRRRRVSRKMRGGMIEENHYESLENIQKRAAEEEKELLLLEKTGHTDLAPGNDAVETDREEPNFYNNNELNDAYFKNIRNLARLKELTRVAKRRKPFRSPARVGKGFGRAAG